MKKTILLIFFLLLTSNSFAAFKLDNLGPDDIGKISKEFSANFLFSSVSPAHGLGDIFGVEIGLLGGVTDSPEIDKLVHEIDASESVPQIAHAAILAAVTVPFGLTAELGLIPETTVGDGEISYIGLAAKWTLTHSLLSGLPFDLAVRGHYSKGEFSYSQTVNNASTLNIDVLTKASIDNTVYGGDLMLSVDLPLVEPYIGIGYAKGSTDISVSGSATVSIFNTSLYASNTQSVEVSDTSSRFFMGLQFDLFLAHLSAEYSRLFGTNRYTGKLSLYF